MITQAYLNTEIDLAKRIFIYYTDKLLDIYSVGNKNIQPWYNDSLAIDYLINALMVCDVINGSVFIGANEMPASYLSGISARVREFLNYELRQIVYAELDQNDYISIQTPSEPPAVIVVNSPALGWVEEQIEITVDDITEVALPFDIAIADIYSLSVTINGDDPISLAAPDEEGCHIIGSTLYWHNYYNLKIDDILVIKFQRII